MGIEVNKELIKELNLDDKDKYKAEIVREVIQTIFSEDDKKITQVTDLKRDELGSANALEVVLYHMIVRRYCFNPIIRKNLREAFNKVYYLRNSIDRQRETKLFEILKQETVYPYGFNQDNNKKWI